MSGVPASDSRESVSSRGTGDPDNSTSHERGPLVTNLVGEIAALRLVPGSTAQPLSAWRHSELFHEVFTDSNAFVTRFFAFSEVLKKAFSCSDH